MVQNSDVLGFWAIPNFLGFPQYGNFIWSPKFSHFTKDKLNRLYGDWTVSGCIKGEVQDFFKISQITQFCPLIHVRYVLRDHASPLPSNRPSKFLGGGACPPKFSGGGACPPMRQTAPHAPLIDPSRPVLSCDSTDTSRTSLHAIALHAAVDTVHWCMSCRLTIAFAHYGNPSQRMDVNSAVRSKQTTSETPLSLIWWRTVFQVHSLLLMRKGRLSLGEANAMNDVFAIPGESDVGFIISATSRNVVVANCTVYTMVHCAPASNGQKFKLLRLRSQTAVEVYALSNPSSQLPSSASELWGRYRFTCKRATNYFVVVRRSGHGGEANYRAVVLRVLIRHCSLSACMPIFTLSHAAE